MIKQINKKNLLRWSIVAGFIVYVLIFIKPISLINQLENVDSVYLPFWVVLYLFALTLGSLNIYILLAPFYEGNFLAILKIDFFAASIGYFTPGQIGNPISLLRALKLKEISYTQSILVFILDKTISLVVAFILGTIGLILIISPYGEIHLNSFHVSKIFIISTAILIVIGLCVLLLNHKIYMKIKFRMHELLNLLRLYKHRKKLIIINIISTLSIQVILAASWYLAFLSLGNSVNYITILLTIPVLTIVGYLPISVGGIGTQEFSAVFIWSFVGLSAPSVIAIFVLIRLLTYIVSFLIILSIKYLIH